MQHEPSNGEMQFKDIIGHRETIEKLKAMADSGKLPHALMLYGPAGTGKTRIARAFIQYLNCSNRTGGDSCGKCPGCLQTAKLNNPDIHYAYPIVKNTKTAPQGLAEERADVWKSFIEEHTYMPYELWLEAIDAGNSQPLIYKTESEEILRLSALSAYGSGYKIFMMWLPEKMNADAANRLLKVIEEPHPDTIFLMVSNNAGALLPTIRSRVQGIEVGRLPESDIAEYICSLGKSYEEAEVLAKIAKGNMNTASLLAEHGSEIAEFRQAFIGVMRAAYARKMPELKEYADNFAGYGREKSIRLLEYFARIIRESFISNLHCDALEAMTPEEAQFVSKFGPFINSANIEEIARETDRAREDISRNGNQKIVWFDFLVQLTRLIRTKGMEQARQTR